MVRDFKPRRIASGEVGHHLVDSNSGVLIVIDLDVHCGLEFEVGCDNTRFPILALKVGPKKAGSVHGFRCQVPLDLGGQSEHNVADGFLVIVLPVLDLFPVLVNITL